MSFSTPKHGLARLALALVLAGPLASPLAAQDAPKGDAEAGAKVFAKCQTCHVVADADGNILAGKAAKTGPNLYGLPGRTAASIEGFKYGKSLAALGATGFAWSEADFVTYVADPTKFLKEKLEDKGAKSQMSFKLGKEEDALNVWAFIASLSPAAEAPASN